MTRPIPPRRILYAQYANPAAYPPLQHSARILADAGWCVVVLGIDDMATHALDFPKHPNITLKRLSFVELGWRRAFYFLFFMIWMIGWTWRWRPQWLYASDLYATPVAWLLSYAPGLRVLYHEHDTPMVARGLAKFCVVARARLVRRAAISVLPNAARAKKFAQQFDVAAKTFCVWNCPERGEVDEEGAGGRMTPPLRNAGNLFRVLYHGSLTPAHLPLTVLEALAQLPESVNLRVVGYETIGHAGYMHLFLERAQELGVVGRVEWLGAVPRAELLALARECDVGLALMPLGSDEWNERAMAGASNKPFDYMACGLGLIVSDLDDWRALYVANGFARVCKPQNASSIADAVRWYFERRAERAIRAARAQQKILDEWNYETQFAPVFTRLARDSK